MKYKNNRFAKIDNPQTLIERLEISDEKFFQEITAGISKEELEIFLNEFPECRKYTIKKKI